MRYLMMQLRIAIGLALLAFETHAEMNPESFMKLCGAVQMIHAMASDCRVFIGSGVLVGQGATVLKVKQYLGSTADWF